MLTIIIFSIISIRLFSLQILQNEKYLTSLTTATEKTIKGSSAPRGRIYDRNYKLLVDNQAIKTIYYKIARASYCTNSAEGGNGFVNRNIFNIFK